MAVGGAVSKGADGGRAQQPVVLGAGTCARDAKNSRGTRGSTCQEAQALGQPASFVSSTHLEKLQAEITAAAPPALSAGISTETPLVLKGTDGTEFRFTSITVDDSLGADKVDVAAHIKVAALGDATATRKLDC